MHLPVMTVGSEIAGIAPGNYTVWFQGQDVATMRAVTLTGDTTLQLGDAVGTSIKGRVVSDGGDTTARPSITLQDEATRNFFSEAVQPDGSFEIHRAQAGHYVLGLTNDRDVYLAKIEVKGALYANGELDVQQGAHVELAITVGHGLAKVDGIVLQDKKPVAGAMVILDTARPQPSEDHWARSKRQRWNFYDGWRDTGPVYVSGD